MSMNKCCFVGRLGKDIELKETQSGIKYAKFSLAVDRNYKSGEERITDWIDFTAWRSTAEFVAKWFHKGDVIGVVGSLQIDKYTDDQGNNRRSAYVVADTIHFVESKKSADVSAPAAPAPAPVVAPSIAEDDDDLPF